MDGSILYCTSSKISNVLTKSGNAAETLFLWFRDNMIKETSDKYNLIINNNKESFQITIAINGNKAITNSKCQKIY